MIFTFDFRWLTPLYLNLLFMQNLIMEYVDHSAGLLIDLLQGLLKFEPSERLKASEALSHPFFEEGSRMP